MPRIAVRERLPRPEWSPVFVVEPLESGRIFGYLRVIEEAAPRWTGRQYIQMWKCRCLKCGSSAAYSRYNLLRDHSTQCRWCALKYMSSLVFRHGRAGTRLYHWWRSWRRKIGEVCDRWRVAFENVLADVGDLPAGKFMSRINPAKPFGPGNFQITSEREIKITNAVWMERLGMDPNDEASMNRIAGLSRQRLFQLWNRRRGLCVVCGSDAKGHSRCPRCLGNLKKKVRSR